MLTCKFLRLIVLLHFFVADSLIIRNTAYLKLLQLRLKRDVTVVSTRAGDPCPTIVDSNRQVGAGLTFGPRLGGNLYAQGQNTNPLQGFKSWGGNIGANDLSLQRGFNLGIPLPSKVLDSRNSGCQQSSPTVIGPQSSVQTIPNNQFVQPPQPVQPVVQPVQPVNSVNPVLPDQPSIFNPQPVPSSPFGTSNSAGSNSAAGLPIPPALPGESSAQVPSSRNPFDNTGVQDGSKLILDRHNNG